jgi:hypothetical protein
VAAVKGFSLGLTNAYLQNNGAVLASPCQSFGVTLVSPSEFTAYINNVPGLTSQTFNTQSTNSFSYYVFDSMQKYPQPVLVYNVSVIPCKPCFRSLLDSPWAVAASVADITTYPGGNSIAFNPTQREYSFVTAHPYISVTVAANVSSTIAVINGHQGFNANISLVQGQNTSIVISLQSTNFTCDVLTYTYTIYVEYSLIFCSLLLF